MTKEELDEVIRTILIAYSSSVDKQGQYDADGSSTAREYSRLILDALKSNGYASPDECLQCQERQRESERKVDQQGLQEELDYWKHKYQWR